VCLPRFDLWVMVNGLSTTVIELYRIAFRAVSSVGFESTTFGQLSDETGDYFCGISVRE